MNREQVLATLRRLKPELERRFGVVRLGVFGSLARDAATSSSDVDVVVEMPPDLFAMVHLRDHLETNLQMPVDLVRYRKHMNAFLKRRIDTEAFYV